MNIDDARQSYYEHSGKLSDVNRQLAFAGIAVIWIFATITKGEITLPDNLIFPLYLFIIVLALDLFHYIALAWFWGGFQQIKEWQDVSESEEFKAPRWINTPGWTFWMLKVIANIWAYENLLKGLGQMLF